ncbi:Dual specificity protein phosphatase 16 [Bulinus truncatus]|nr:Dual specificity protein phosphatase 16 [Bulinus truncatus]
MVIDSRSFLEYNTSNIHQSVNVCCSKLVKRRLQQDKVHVLDLLNQACNIGADSSWDVIVYDQCTEDPSHLTSDNFVQVLLNKLSSTFNSVAFLKGGFLAFQASHSGLTENKSGSHRCSTLTSLSQPCMPVSNIGPTRILPFLYLGSQQDSLNQEVAQVNGITYILNVSKTCPRPPYILESHFHRIPVNDNYCEKLMPYFYEAFQFLDKVREANGCVLVHCLGGVSRSATLAIAYIMKYMRMSSDEAYRYVKDKRPTISPNFNFLGQLLEYEKVIRKEEMQEEARREAFKASLSDETVSFDTERASPGSMDLHTTSPSSPGPRTIRQAASASASIKLNQSQEHSSLLFSDGIPHLPAWTSRRHSFAKSPAGRDGLQLLPKKHFSLQETKPFPTLQHGESACFNAATLHLSSRPSMTCYQPSSFSENVANICDKQPRQDLLHSAQTPVCPITGFPSPGGASQDFPESTCMNTGFPGPEQYGSNDYDMTGSSSIQTFTAETKSLDNCAYHTSVKSSNTLKTTESRESSPGISLPLKKEHPPKVKQGISFSSILSNFRWKSRPPTLPLGSPVGPVKDAGRFTKKQESSSCGDSRVQLTPVSEAVENIDLSSVDETAITVTNDIQENRKDSNDISVQTLSNSGSSHATNSTMASKGINFPTSSTPFISEIASPSSDSALKSASLRLSARNFTLALSSPTSDFPVTFSPSSHKISPNDSNKRKSGLTTSDSDSPDKLAKTEDYHRHTLTPPKTLNISQGPPDKLRQRTCARRSFVLPLSSPTSAMARLNFASPSEPTLGDTTSTAQEGGSLTLAADASTFMDVDRHLDLYSISAYSIQAVRNTVACSTSESIFSKAVGELNPGDAMQTNSSSSSQSSSFSCEASEAASLSSQPCSVSPVTDLSSVNLQGFQELPTTSLDQLSFTPCYTKDIVQELKSREMTFREDQSMLPNEPRSSALDSPMSISSGSSAPSLASSTLSPIDTNMVNPFSDNAPKNHNENLPAFQPESYTGLPSTAGLPSMSSFGSPQGTPDSVLSPNSEFILSVPQATIAPTLPTLSSPVFYSSTSSLEPLSPMSVIDSASGSPKWLSQKNSLCSPTQSSASSPVLSLSSPIVSSPSLSPLVTSPATSLSHLASTTTSSYSSVISTNSMTKVIRRDKSKRVIDRPYSIAFSSYPACDLVPEEPGSTKSNSSQGHTSQDDASEVYMSVSGKRSRLSMARESNSTQGRTSWGGYSEREVYNKYKQITAAMENAMMRTQAFSPGSNNSSRASSRKARSLDDFLDSNAEDDENLTFKGGNQRWRHYGEQHLLEPYHCGMHSTSEPYHSSSSLSSNGSHGSSLEIIQVS